MCTSARVFAIVGMLAAAWHIAATPFAQAQPRALSAEEITERSDIVAVGRVSDMISEWNADRTRIVTRVRIVVREVIKGERPGQALNILTPGGEIGDVGELYVGSARFRPGEEVVVFARQMQGNEMRVAGGARGKFTIEREKATGRLMVNARVSLDDLRDRVRTAMRAVRSEEGQP